MANFTGNAGIIMIGGTAVGSVVTFSITITGDIVESTVLGDSWRTNLPTLNSWTGTAGMYFDVDDTVQTTLIPGTLLTFELLPEGNTTGDYSATGSAYIVTVDKANDLEAVVNLDITFTGSGALVISTVT